MLEVGEGTKANLVIGGRIHTCTVKQRVRNPMAAKDSNGLRDTWDVVHARAEDDLLAIPRNVFDDRIVVTLARADLVSLNIHAVQAVGRCPRKRSAEIG